MDFVTALLEGDHPPVRVTVTDTVVAMRAVKERGIEFSARAVTDWLLENGEVIPGFEIKEEGNG